MRLSDRLAIYHLQVGLMSPNKDISDGDVEWDVVLEALHGQTQGLPVFFVKVILVAVVGLHNLVDD